MFLRLFVGLMLSQFGIRQLIDGGAPTGGILSIPFVCSDLATWLVIVVEIICSFFIMIGLFTRLMIVPPFVLMIASCHHIASLYGPGSTIAIQLMCTPFLFMGIYGFLLIVGPGKISLDYFYSLYLIHRNLDKDREEDLEEV